MTERTIMIVNPLGLHARPAAMVVKLAATFNSQVEIVRDGVAVNAKSIMGVMMLSAEYGASVTIRANGADEDSAVAAIADLFATGFGES